MKLITQVQFAIFLAFVTHNALAGPYDVAMSDSCEDGGCGSGGGFFEIILGLLLLGAVITLWAGGVIERQIKLWPFALVIGGLGVTLADAPRLSGQIFGWILIGITLLVMVLRNKSEQNLWRNEAEANSSSVGRDRSVLVENGLTPYKSQSEGEQVKHVEPPPIRPVPLEQVSATAIRVNADKSGTSGKVSSKNTSSRSVTCPACSLEFEAQDIEHKGLCRCPHCNQLVIMSGKIIYGAKR